MYQNVTEEQKSSILLQVALSEALKTSEIEGEYYSREDILSSLQKKLGLTNAILPVKDKKAKEPFFFHGSTLTLRKFF